jgi:hypothetical protein
MKITNDVDMLALKDALICAGRKAFTEMRRGHCSERFYCIGLITTGDMGYVLPTAMTEEGLETVARKYKALQAYAATPLDQLRRELRWSPSDSPLLYEGKIHFDEVDRILDVITRRYQAIKTDHGSEESEDFWQLFVAAVCGVLAALDHERVFGTGRDREKVFVTMLIGDQDDSILHIGRRLNPSSTVAWFEKEWKAWTEYWTRGEGYTRR